MHDLMNLPRGQERCTLFLMSTDPSPTSSIILREACAEDASVVVHLIRQMADEGEEQSPIDEKYVRGYLSGADRHILLAQTGERVNGLLSYSARADLFHAGNSILIEELVVDEGHRGQGLGARLMDALFERAHAVQCKEVCLAVMPGNEGAIRFYKRHGLVEEALFLEKHFC